MDKVVRKVVEVGERGKKAAEAYQRSVKAYEGIGLSHKEARIAATCEARITEMDIDWAKFEL